MPRSGSPLADSREHPQAITSPITLLDLVDELAQIASNDAEVVAAVADLLESGRVTLVGNFRGRHVQNPVS